MNSSAVRAFFSTPGRRVALNSLPGVRLITWTLLAVIDWCFLPYVLLGLSLTGVRLFTWTMIPTVIQLNAF
jgi:hypothetical protein